MPFHGTSEYLRLASVGLRYRRARIPATAEPVRIGQATYAGVVSNDRLRKKTRAILTNNAVVAGVVSAIVAGAISFAIAHYQSQDSARQAIASQQTQDVTQLEADVRTFDQLSTRTFVQRRKCASLAIVTPECKAAGTTNILDSPLISPEMALGADLANISDTVVSNDTNSFEYYALEALANASTDQGFIALKSMNDAYSKVIARCGQLIKGPH